MLVLFSCIQVSFAYDECSINGPEDYYYNGVCTNGTLRKKIITVYEPGTNEGGGDDIGCGEVCVCNTGYYYDKAYQNCTVPCPDGHYNSSRTTCAVCDGTITGCSYTSAIDSDVGIFGCREENCKVATIECDYWYGACWDGTPFFSNIVDCLPGFYYDGNPDFPVNSCIPVWYAEPYYYKTNSGMCENGLYGCAGVYRCPDYTDPKGKVAQGGIWSAYRAAGIETWGDGTFDMFEFENYLGVGASISSCEIESGQPFSDNTGSWEFTRNCKYRT